MSMNNDPRCDVGDPLASPSLGRRSDDAINHLLLSRWRDARRTIVAFPSVGCWTHDLLLRRHYFGRRHLAIVGIVIVVGITRILILPSIRFVALGATTAPGSCTLHLSHPLEPLVDEIVANVGGLSFVILPTSPAGRRRT